MKTTSGKRFVAADSDEAAGTETGTEAGENPATRKNVAMRKMCTT
jgi:hypothetical protein